MVAPAAASRLLVAWLLATPDIVSGFGSLQYLNRPTTELTTYTGTPDPHMPLPLTFNNGELEINTDPTTNEVIVKQNVMPPPPVPRPPSPLAPPPPTPYEHFSGGACDQACHKQSLLADGREAVHADVAGGGGEGGRSLACSDREPRRACAGA